VSVNLRITPESTDKNSAITWNSMMEAETKHTRFAKIVSEVKACTKCERMHNSARVLNYSAGNLNAELFFIGEAPGRLGADETEVPFHGDKSGRNFEDLISFAGISRNDVYVTNAVLCNPKDEDGNNGTPTLTEAANCQPFLARQIALVDPKIVVTLGNTALQATAAIESHNYSLSRHVRTIHSWFGRTLIPLYHPGQRAMIHRSFANQRSDYQFVAEQWKRLTEVRKASSGATRPDVMAVARYLLASRGAVTYFELHKLAYLTEYLHVRKSGRRLTSAYFIRQKDGPYCTDLELDRIRRADASIRVFKEDGKLCLSLGKSQMPQLFSEIEKPDISKDAKAAADEAIQRYGDKSDSELKTATYLTAPMRFMLRREQSAKVNHYNAPIDFLAAR
jgi:uracil-DNA glycosylase family 4